MWITYNVDECHVLRNMMQIALLSVYLKMTYEDPHVRKVLRNCVHLLKQDFPNILERQLSF